MKRLTAALLLTGAVALAAATAVSADTVGDSTGPACSDIVTGVASYNVTNPDTGEANVYTVTADVTYAGATCKNVQYTLTVTYLSDGKTKTKDQTIKGDDVSTTLHFQLNNVVADGGGNGSVCVSTTTGSGVGKPYDVAPDPGCVTISADSSGGGGTPQF